MGHVVQGCRMLRVFVALSMAVGEPHGSSILALRRFIRTTKGVGRAHCDRRLSHTLR